MKKVVLKRILWAVAILALIALLYAYSVMVFMPKTWDDTGGKTYYNFAEFNSEPKNTIDMVMLGNSDMYSGFSPVEQYRQTGATAFVRAGSRESINAVAKTLKSSFKKQSPKLVVIDVDCFFSEPVMGHGTDQVRVAPWVAPFVYHSRWKELKFRDFVTLPKAKTSKLKGYIFESNINSKYKLKEHYMEDVSAEPKQLDKRVYKNMDKIVKLCKKNKAKLCLVCLPTPITWTNAKSNAIANLAKKYGADFLDLNLPQEGYEFDYSCYFKDNGNHQNFVGAQYTTKYLSKYFDEKYDLPDHRNDKKYSSWDESVKYYDGLVAKAKGEANGLAV